jgi:hypothetical protein
MIGVSVCNAAGLGPVPILPGRPAQIALGAAALLALPRGGLPDQNAPSPPCDGLTQSGAGRLAWRADRPQPLRAYTSPSSTVPSRRSWAGVWLARFLYAEVSTLTNRYLAP